MASAARDGPGWLGKVGEAAAGYRERRADFEPLARLLIDVVTLVTVLRRRRGSGGVSCFSEEERP